MKLRLPFQLYKSLLFVLGLSTFSTSVFAEDPKTVTWKGGESGEWFDGGKGWTSGGTDASFVSGDNVSFGANSSKLADIKVKGDFSIGTIGISSSGHYRLVGDKDKPSVLTSTGALAVRSRFIIGEGIDLTASSINSTSGDSNVCITVEKGGTLTSAGKVTVMGSQENYGSVYINGGTFIVKGKTLSMDMPDFKLGHWGGSNSPKASLVMDGGLLSVAEGSFGMGYSATVTFTQSDGVLEAKKIIIGNGGKSLTVDHTGGLWKVGSDGIVVSNKNYTPLTWNLGGGKILATSTTVAQADVLVTILTAETTSGIGAETDCTFTWNGKLTGGGMLETYGTGTLVLKNGANDYSGGTKISTGTLVVGTAGALGSGGIILAGGIADLGGFATTNDIEVTGNSKLIGITGFSGSLTLTAGELTGDAIILTSGKSFVFKSGAIANNLSGAGGVSKETAGVMTLSGNNSYTGATSIEAGELIITGALTGSDVTVKNTGTLKFADQGAVSGNIMMEAGSSLDTGEAGLLLVNGQAVTVEEGALVTGNLSMGEGSTLTLKGEANLDGVLNLSQGSFFWEAPKGMTAKGLVLGDKSLNLGGGQVYTMGSEGISGGSLTVAGAVTFKSGESWTMDSAVAMTAGNIVFDTTHTIQVDGAISGTGNLTKSGDGKLVLTGASSFDGGVTIQAGALLVGNDTALGTGGSVKVSAGTTLAAEGKSVVLGNAIVFGTNSDTQYGVTLGQAGQKEKLTLGGNAQFASTNTTLTVLSEVEFSGSVSNTGTSLTKAGAGMLVFSGTLPSWNEINVNAGGLGFGSNEALSNVGTIKLADGTTLNLGGFSGKNGQTVSFDNEVNFAGAGGYGGTVALSTVNSRITVAGDFHAEKIIFNLGSSNTSDIEDKILVKTTGTATISGEEKGSIDLNFNENYAVTNTGGTFKLFSSGLNYEGGAILNRQRQLVSLNTDQLSKDGSITWTKPTTEVKWATADVVADINNKDYYTSSGPSVYLGAPEGSDLVVIDSGVRYDLDGYSYYMFTPGKGTLQYQGVLTNEGGSEVDLGAGVNVSDYANITGNKADHSTGAVILSNNGNSYAKGTNISSTTLVVDMSVDKGQALSPTGTNLTVNVLGTGRVEIGAGFYGGTLVLKAYGDEVLAGVNTFTYGNEIFLDGGSALIQEGSNAQILTGDIHAKSGSNIIINRGNKSLTLSGNITQENGEKLTLHSETGEGRLILSGEKTLKTEGILEITGNGRVSLAEGYSASASGIQLNNGGSLSVEKESTLIMARNSITGTGTLLLNGGTLKSESSWASEVAVSLGVGTNSLIQTGGANVRFNKGVIGSGSFEKTGTGSLYIYDNKDQNAAVGISVLQGKLILKGDAPLGRAVVAHPGEYRLTGDLVLVGGKGASLEGMIDANNHKVIFGDNTKFFMSVSEEQGLAGYIRNADTITFNTGAKLYLDVLDDTWVTNTDYTIFSANNGIIGADNLGVVMENEFAFVDVLIDKTNANEINLVLSRKGGGSGGAGLSDGTNKGAIHAAMAPLVADVLDEKSALKSSMLRTVQTVSKMTTTEYDTYLVDMASSAVSYYTALSAQVYDATQHLNSVRNRVELINPVLYDDWSDGGVYNVWVGGVNHYRDVKSDFQSPGYEMTSWGGELGCAIPLSESFMMGVGFAYTSTEVTVKDNWGTNESDTYNVDVFARYRQDRWTLTGVLTGGFSNVDFHRNQLIKDQMTRSNSSSDGNQFMGTFEAMYDVYLNEEKSWILQPLVNLTAGRAKLDGLSETGDLKNAGLDLDSQSYNMLSVGVGAKIAYEYQNSVSDLPGRVELKAMYVNDAGDVDFKVNGRFMGAPGSDFELDGVSNERSAVVVSAGWIAPISTYGQFFADASCEFRKDQTGVSSTVGFSFQF